MPNTGAKVPYIHVVAGIIRDPKRPQHIFVTQRPKGKHLEDLWEFPGGKVEPLESRYHALQRELKEEVGILVTSAEPLQSVFHRYKEKKIHLDVWDIKHYEGKPHGKEGQNSLWMPISEWKDYQFPDADIPVLTSLSLPGKLLITPDVSAGNEQSFIDHFQRLMKKHPYPLTLFRSHQLEDGAYAEVASELNAICKPANAELIIHRPSLKSLKADVFNDYRRRHLGSFVLHSLRSNPFPEDVVVSASCHDKAELRMADQIGCQFTLLSTIRETLSHPGRTPKGWYQFKKLVKKSRVPVYALGGVRRKDYYVSRFQGAVGVAGVTDFWSP